MAPLLEGDPDLSHIDTYDHVYEPAEDTFLLMDSMKKDLQYINANMTTKYPITLEVGSGSGILTTYLAMILKKIEKNKGCYYATDINPIACMTTMGTMRHNHIHTGHVICTDLVNGLDSLHNKVDIMLFNPPYVPTPSSELLGDGIERSWAGGKDGREVLDLLLPLIGKMLSNNGVFYLLLLKANKPNEVCSILKQQGLSNELILSRKSQLESLSVYRFFREIKD